MYSAAMTSSGSTNPPTGGFPATTFYSRTYDEALGLVAEALDYARDSRQPSPQPAAKSLLRSLESLRLTTRLTQIMAWLLLQRAVHAGELSPDEAAAPSNRLGGRKVCCDRCGERMQDVPEGLRDLLLRSRKLYQRIARLDEMMTRDTGFIAQ